MNWRTVLSFVQHWWWLITLITGGVLVPVFFGVKKWTEIWDWYLERFYDSKVLLAVRKRMFHKVPDVPFPWLRGQAQLKMKTVEMGHSPESIAKIVGRTSRSVLKFLKRLERGDKVVVDYSGHWFPK
jgi:hypothetical protein